MHVRCSPQGLIETQCPEFSLGANHTGPSAWQVRDPDSVGEHVHSMSHVLAQTGYTWEPPISEGGGSPQSPVPDIAQGRPCRPASLRREV